jgi:esterase/lipase|tara:strand:+ start:1192 stop:1497 length:306 start_codon:yes stop_codon:yes gene_type:complete
MMGDITNKKVAVDLDGDGKSDVKIDIKFLGLLVGGIISLTMTYSQLTSEIEVAKTLPEYKIEQDDTKVINQKIDYLIKELEKYEEQTNRRLNSLEDKVYKK